METRPRSLPVRILSNFWRGVDESRRFVVNVLFLALVVVPRRSGDLRRAEGAEGGRSRREAEGSSRRAAHGPELPGLPRGRDGRRAAGDAPQGPARRHPGREGRQADLVDLPRHVRHDGRRPDEDRGPARRAPRLPEERQEGDRLFRALPPGALRDRLRGRRGLAPPRGGGPVRGLRPVADLLQGRPRPARRRRSRLPRRRVQVLRRALPPERRLARGEGSGPEVAGRPLGLVGGRRGREPEAQARGCPRLHRPDGRAAGGGEGRPREDRRRGEARRQARVPGRGPEADDRDRGREQEGAHLPAGERRRLPRGEGGRPERGNGPRRRGRRRRRGRDDRRRQGAGRDDRRRLDRRPHPAGRGRTTR